MYLCALASPVRIKAKGNSIAAARTWALHCTGHPPPLASSALHPPSAPVLPHPPPSSIVRLPFSKRDDADPRARSHAQQDDGNGSISPSLDVNLLPTSPPAASGCPQQSYVATTLKSAASFRDNGFPVAAHDPTGSNRLAASVDVSCSSAVHQETTETMLTTTTKTLSQPPTSTPCRAPPSIDAPAPPSLAANHRNFKRSAPPLAASAALEAALACARGVGGRLGTPLGNPLPAQGNNWTTGRSASAMASSEVQRSIFAAANRLPSTPGSRFFPPFLLEGTPGAGECSPATFEMVKDAADDEDEEYAFCGNIGKAIAGEGGGVGESGWRGLTLYRYDERLFEL